MANELAGQVALVTGGGRGIGRAIALEYAAAGARIAITARSADQLDETVALVKGQGGTIISIPGDVSDPASVADVCGVVERELGPVTVLMNNAGTTGPFGPLWEVDAYDWWHTLEIHLRGSFLFINRIVPGMIERGSGRVINMVSGAGIAPRPNFSGYGIAKAAQIRLAETLAVEGKEHGLIAFAMSPGLVITELAEHTMRSADAQKWNREFVDRLSSEKSADNYETSMAKVTELALTLASGRADRLSGQHLGPSDDVEALLKQAVS